MPRVKIDYVVSFSSEDPEHPAQNLLAWEVSKKKWLCKKGESSCSVVLQLTKAVTISAVHIGAYHSAMVEVLVARSEKGSEQYQVLVPSCVFVPPAESRRDAAAERVRSFSAEQLAAEARRQRWDRVRVVCSQPYNRHCKFGLSFIHIDEAGEAPAPQAAPQPAAVPQRMLALETFSSDEDEFRPGELFAKHLQSHSDSQSRASDTGAQIRQATSQALKNISDTSTKLMKTPISKPSKRANAPTSEGRSDRTRDTLLYTDDDERPHTKIDQVVQRHKDQKQKDEKAKSQEKLDKKEIVHKTKDESRTPKRRKSDSPLNDTPPSKKVSKNHGESTSDKKNRTDDRSKRPRLTSEETEQVSEEPVEPHMLLKDVVLVLSGYENPQRANLRNTALAMGARVERDWGPTCTHLICAFPSTPKLRQVRAASGASVPAVLGQWLLQCSARRRRLPCQWFATEPEYRRPEPAPLEPAPPVTRTSPAQADDDTECDTDDEIEKVLQKQKAKQLAASPANKPTISTSPRHVSDKRPAAMEVDEGPSTDEESAADESVPRFGGALPNFFDGHTFVIDAEEADAEILSRYVTAYGGLVLQLSQLQEDSAVDFVVSARARPVARAVAAAWVAPAWVARCLAAARLLPPD